MCVYMYLCVRSGTVNGVAKVRMTGKDAQGYRKRILQTFVDMVLYAVAGIIWHVQCTVLYIIHIAEKRIFV